MKPWELAQYSFKEFLIAVRGNSLKEAREWDRTRHIMFMVAKSVSGKKGPKKASDILQLPLIDKPEQWDRGAARRKLQGKKWLAKRYYEYKEESNKKLTVSNGESGS